MVYEPWETASPIIFLKLFIKNVLRLNWHFTWPVRSTFKVTDWDYIKIFVAAYLGVKSCVFVDVFDRKLGIFSGNACIAC